MAVLPMFPLGSVLFPQMPISLRVFEERYLIMLSELVRERRDTFGIVLIERGREVGGGDQRFAIGTVATLMDLRSDNGMVGLVAIGGARFGVDEWLPDQPYPRAEVTLWPDLVWGGEDALLEEAEACVRRTLAAASEFSSHVWSPDVVLSDEPVVRAWQLSAVAPIGPLDQLSLLNSTSVTQLLSSLITVTSAAALEFTAPAPGTTPSDPPSD